MLSDGVKQIEAMVDSANEIETLAQHFSSLAERELDKYSVLTDEQLMAVKLAFLKERYKAMLQAMLGQVDTVSDDIFGVIRAQELADFVNAFFE